ncbi:MAG: hypothetical protein IBJ17_06615 [Reyranella sp.]|nr:hypothetical protein [Reyranella sp.]
MPVLEAFYRKTHPSLAGWKPVAERVQDVQPDRDGWANIGCWIAGCLLIYGTLFGSGKLILGETTAGIVYLAIAVASGWFIQRSMSKRGWSTLSQ